MKHYQTKNEDGTRKVSPSKIMGFYYPMDLESIPDVVLTKAGRRGTIVHNLIEKFILTGEVTSEDIIKEQYDVEQEMLEEKGYTFDEKDLLKSYYAWCNIKEEIPKLNLDKGSQKVEQYIDELYNIHGYIDYFDDNKIIDWKTNASMDKKTIEKYSLQLNLYRYMIYKQFGKIIPEMYICHIKGTEKVIGSRAVLVKMIKVVPMEFEELEIIITEVFNFENKIEKEYAF